MDTLDRARARFPVGTHVRARVVVVPKPGVIGVFLRAGEPPTGFVDVLWLPRDPSAWPQMGDESEFEVLQHRVDQMRLWPLDPLWRAPFQPTDDQTWRAVAEVLRVGDVLPRSRRAGLHSEPRVLG
jgi:hypothetical protein